MPCLALPCPALPRLPCLATPCPAGPSPATPAMPCRAVPGRAVPSPATPALPRRALPRLACLACLDYLEPSPTQLGLLRSAFTDADAVPSQVDKVDNGVLVQHVRVVLKLEGDGPIAELGAIPKVRLIHADTNAVFPHLHAGMIHPKQVTFLRGFVRSDEQRLPDCRLRHAAVLVGGAHDGGLECGSRDGRGDPIAEEVRGILALFLHVEQLSNLGRRAPLQLLVPHHLAG